MYIQYIHNITKNEIYYTINSVYCKWLRAGKSSIRIKSITISPIKILKAKMLRFFSLTFKL